MNTGCDTRTLMNTTKRDLIIFICAGALVLICFLLAFIPQKRIPAGEQAILNFSVYQDVSAAVDIEDILTHDYSFEQKSRTTVYARRSPNAFWLRFTFPDQNQSTESRFLWIKNASLEQIEVYFPGYPPVYAGKKQAVSSIPMRARDWFIPVPLDISAGETIHIRVKTNTIMWIPLQMIRTSQMTRQIVHEYLFFGLFFGILLTIIFINGVSFFLLKNKNFIIYTIYLTALLIYQIRVHGFLYLIPMPFAVLEAILWLSLGVMGIFLMIFAKAFMNLSNRMPITSSILNTCIALFIAQTIIGIFFSVYWANQIAYITGFIVPFVVLFAAIRLYILGHHEIRFYLIAWFSMIAGTTIWSSAAYAQVQIPANYFFTVGTAINSLLFTLAIFDTLRMELQEKELVIERENYYKTLSRSDSLTGLYNRRYLSELVKRLDSEGEIPAGSALIMLDLDKFKIVNDTYGHLAGDMILSKTGAHIKKHIRKTDIPCRYGGDEFLIFLPGANEAAARNIAELISNDILEDITHSEKGEEIKITVSIGLSENRLDDSFDGLFLRADAALYQAKKLGRNRISVL